MDPTSSTTSSSSSSSTNRRPTTVQVHQNTPLKQQQSQQQSHQKQKSRQQHQQQISSHQQRIENETLGIPLCANGCNRYYYDSPVTSSFSDFTPPRDMPQSQLQLQQQQQQQQQKHQIRKQSHQQFCDDPDTIEFCLDEESAMAKKYYKQNCYPSFSGGGGGGGDSGSGGTTSNSAMNCNTLHCSGGSSGGDSNTSINNSCHTIATTANSHRNSSRQHHSKNNNSNFEPHVRWSRNNIAVTMERFHPIASPSSSASDASSCASSSHQDYSYAYYEPGAIMCHSNIPTPDDCTAGPSTSSKALSMSPTTSQGLPPPPNSIRALLLKTKEKSHKTLPAANRHMYTTRYGTHENIYEDVSDEKTNRLVSSEQSLSERGCTKKEFQHILSNHYRVLEELNLSVEELLMSTTPPNEQQSPLMVRATTSDQQQSDSIVNQLSTLDLKDDTRSPVSEIILGEDSGFSGSSSGASYIGSLRNYKTAITRSLRRSSAPNCTSTTVTATGANSSGGGYAGGTGAGGHTNKTLYGSCRTTKFPHELRQGSFYNTNHSNHNHNNSHMMMSNGTKFKIPPSTIATSSTSGLMNNKNTNDSQKGVKFLLWNKRS